MSSLYLNLAGNLQSTYIYKEYTTVYVPSSELGVCPPPPEPGGGGHTSLRVRGWGSPSSDDVRKSLALCLLCVVTLPIKH
jgi:hypothetical protein